MKPFPALSLLLPLLLLTGCPSNQYTIDLTPRGSEIERKLEFYSHDGVDTNGAPDYRPFSTAEVMEIARLYPGDSLKKSSNIYTVQGHFNVKLPPDIGGDGSYTNITTTLGSSGFYLERFRGDDDLATRTTKRLRAADKLTDMVIAWSRAELGHEHGYEKLRRFLDKDFREDIKNVTMYGLMVRSSLVTRSDAPEEFAVRFGQYLVERGYITIQDLPELFRVCMGNDSRPVLKRFQRLVATKLGLPLNRPLPASLDFLSDPQKTEESWKKYLMTTDLYRAKLHHWQKEKIVHEINVAGQKVAEFYNPNFRTNKIPAAPDKPSPSDVADEVMRDMMDGVLGADFPFGTDDDVTVRLSLPFAPAHSNGKWDEARKQVIWKSGIERADKDDGRIPAFCYASWCEPNEGAQKQHFGGVILRGDDLLQYCLWRANLTRTQGDEWETLLVGLQPGTELTAKIEAFHFSNESRLQTNGQSGPTPASDFARRLLTDALSSQTNEQVAAKVQ